MKNTGQTRQSWGLYDESMPPICPCGRLAMRLGMQAPSPTAARSGAMSGHDAGMAHRADRVKPVNRGKCVTLRYKKMLLINEFCI